MIDWDSEDWGGGVHLASNGSWVNDRHTHEGNNGTQPVGAEALLVRLHHRENERASGYTVRL